MSTESIVNSVNDAWYWEETDPKTATVVGTFGRDYRPDLFMDKAIANAAYEGFHVGSEFISRTYMRSIEEFAEISGQDFDADAIRKAVVDQLRACEPDHMRAILKEITDLAGGGIDVIDAEFRVGDQIEGENDYECMPVLSWLSQQAMRKLALTRELGPARFASSPNSLERHSFFRTDLIGT